MDCSLSGSSDRGIFQARILEWVPMPTSGGSSWPRVRAHISYVSCVGRQVLYHECHLGSPTNYTDIPKYGWMGSVTDPPPSFVNPKLRWIQYNISCGLRTTIMASPKPTSEKRASRFWVAVWTCSYSLTSTRKGLKITSTGDFPGGPMAKTLHSQCRGPKFDS